MVHNGVYSDFVMTPEISAMDNPEIPENIPPTVAEALDRLCGLFTCESDAPDTAKIRDSAYGLIDALFESMKFKLSSEEIAEFDTMDTTREAGSAEMKTFSAVSSALEEANAPKVLTPLVFFAVDGWRRDNNRQVSEVGVAMFGLSQIMNVENELIAKQKLTQIMEMFSGEKPPEDFDFTFSGPAHA